MPRFRINYYDPVAKEYKEVIETFEDTSTITAAEWAEDAAYMYADKHWHTVEELGN